MLGVLDARSTETEVLARRPRVLAPRQQRRGQWAEAWAGGRRRPRPRSWPTPGQPSATPAARPGGVAKELTDPRRRRILDSTAASRRCVAHQPAFLHQIALKETVARVPVVAPCRSLARAGLRSPLKGRVRVLGAAAGQASKGRVRRLAGHRRCSRGGRHGAGGRRRPGHAHRAV